VDETTVEDELTAVRLEWLAAEAELAGLLPFSTTTSTTSTARPEPAEIAAAIESAEHAHRAYMTVIRSWVGPTPSSAG
jgi:hypothetical protein